MKSQITPAYFHASGGALYDTRREHWSHSRPLRTVYDGGFNPRNIRTGAELRAALRNGSHAFPGGYPVAFYADDGGTLCHGCVRANLRECIASIRDNVNDGWRVIALDVLDADRMRDEDAPDEYPGEHCDHCGDLIE